MAIISDSPGTAGEARATLVSYLGGPNARVRLEDAEVDALLARHRVADRDGRAPVDAGWAGAWALNRAAAEGWRILGSRVAMDYSFSADGASYSKGEVLAHCLEQEARFAALDNGTIYTDGAATAYDYKVDRLWP